MSYARTLVLNTFYRPHDVVDWKDAVTNMFKGSVEVLAQYEEIIGHIDQSTLRSFPKLMKAMRQVIQTDVESIAIKVPAVVVLRRKVSQVKNGVKFSRVNVALRDNFTCQYCGLKLPLKKLNYEHVLPRHQGGKTTWTNIVMSCYPCNTKKANRTPEQANMPLLAVPVKPLHLPMNTPAFTLNTEDIPEEWVPYVGQSAA